VGRTVLPGRHSIRAARAGNVALKEAIYPTECHILFLTVRVCIPFHRIGTHAVMCRTRRYKYIRRYYTERHELFDLETDPGETLNLSGCPEYERVERKLRFPSWITGAGFL